MKHFKYILIISLGSYFFSCSQPEKQIDHNKKVFRYNESKGITTLDPAYAKNQTIIWPVNQIYNGLVQMNANMEVEPCIAKKWKISDSGKIYTFTLRDDVYFHEHPLFHNKSDRTVNAYHFEFSLKRILNPSVASPGAWIFNKLQSDGIHAPNDSTLILKLKEPFPAFLGLLTMQYCSVVSPDIVRHYGNQYRRNPVGTGPYQFKFWKEGEKLILLKNKDYFEKDSAGNSLPYIDAVAISFITDKQSEFLEFLKGNLDFISGVNPANKDELITRSGKLNPKYTGKLKMLTHPYLNTEYLGFQLDTNLYDSGTNPLSDILVRKAINYGFDRAKMMKYLRNSLGYPANQGFIPMGLPAFNNKTKGYHYYPDTVRYFLKQAGYERGNGLPPITLTTTSDYLDICEYIQHQLGEFGISINIDVLPGSTFREMVSNSKLEFFRGSWIADYPDGENYLALFYSKNFCPAGPNYTHYSNEKYDRLYEKALQMQDHQQRIKLYRQLDNMIIQDAVVVPLYYDQVVVFIQNSITGMQLNPMNLLTIKLIKKE